MSHNIFLKVISDKGLGVSKDQSIISVRLLSQWLSSPYTKRKQTNKLYIKHFN